MSPALGVATQAVMDIETWQDPSVQLPPGLDARRCIEAALAAVQRESQSLGLRWVSADESAEMNDRYRGKAGPTNVLAFPAPRLPGLPADSEPDYLGDIVVCVPVMEAEAAAQGKTPRAHAAHLLVHGCLHLAGYAHEAAAEAARMERVETEVLAGLGYEDPYRLQPGGAANV